MAKYRITKMFVMGGGMKAYFSEDFEAPSDEVARQTARQIAERDEALSFELGEYRFVAEQQCDSTPGFWKSIFGRPKFSAQTA